MSVPRSKYVLTHLSDGQLMQDFTAGNAVDSVTLAERLAQIAEIDARQLYRPAGYSSMHIYCVEELHLSEGAAYRRLTSARIARKLPVLFEAVADGRLHLAGLAVMSKYLSKTNVLELVTAATHKTRTQIEILIAERFPKREPATLISCDPAAAECRDDR